MAAPRRTLSRDVARGHCPVSSTAKTQLQQRKRGLRCAEKVLWVWNRARLLITTIPGMMPVAV